MLSPFGVEHSVSKGHDRAGDVAAAGAGAALGGRAGYSVQQRVNGAKADRHLGQAVESLTSAAGAAMKGNDTDRVLHAMAGGEHRLTAGKYMARSESRGRMGAAIATGAGLGAVGASAARRHVHRQGVHKSAFGVEHDVSKSRRRDTAAAVVGAAAGGAVGTEAHSRTQAAAADKNLRLADAHIASTGHASPEGQEYHWNSASRHTQAGKVAIRRFRSKPLRAAAVLGGAALGAAGAVGASRATSRRPVAKSAFGVEHSVSKGFGDTPTPAQRQRLSPSGQKAYRRAGDAAGIGIIGGGAVGMAGNSLRNSGRGGNVEALAETLGEKAGSRNISRVGTNARKIKVGTALGRAGAAGVVGGFGAAGTAAVLGSRAKRKPVRKSAFGVEHPLAKAAVPARLRLTGPQVPPQAAQAKPAKPPTQRLNNAIAATGGPSS